MQKLITSLTIMIAFLASTAMATHPIFDARMDFVADNQIWEVVADDFNNDDIKEIFVFILSVMCILGFMPECFAESVTKTDLADVLPAANLFVRKTEPFGYYLAYNTEGGSLAGVAFVTTEVAPEESWGYRDQITTLIGIDTTGKIIGVKVLSEFENPRYTKGLLVDGSWFLKQFEGKDVGDNLILGGDIDAITGATIT